MNIKQFNAMLKAARELLRHYHMGAEIDPHVTRWAQALTSANPREKRRPAPLRDAILAQFGPLSAGLTREEIAQGLPGKAPSDIASALHDMSHREPRHLWTHRHKGHKLGRYYLSQAQRDAAANDKQATEAAAQEWAEHLRRVKLAKVEANRVARAEKRKASPPKPGAQKPENLPTIPTKLKPCMPLTPKQQRRINPDQGLPWVAKPKAAQEAIIPPGLRVIVCPGFVAPHERPGPVAGEFSAEWARLRGRRA